MSSPNLPNPDGAVLVTIDENAEHQRLDNFLLRLCKGVPKSHVFRIIRSGEVRVNRGRAQASQKLKVGDVVRVPPIRIAVKDTDASNSAPSGVSLARAQRLSLNIPIVYEDEDLLVVNKPSGLAVHGGSGESLGVIECLRLARADTHQSLELVHRIDRETSGLLVIAKKRSALRKLQEQLRERSWKKFYWTLVLGEWPKALRSVDLPLKKVQTSEKEQKVFVDPEGDKALSKFIIKQRLKDSTSSYTLLEVQILTGRTHQIRVHTSANSHPIAGDDRYGQFDQNKILERKGLGRMFLHAARLHLTHPRTGEALELQCELSPELNYFLNQLQTV